MHMTTYRRWVLARRPDGVPQEDCFRLEAAELPELQEGQALIHVEHISVDPGMRSRLSGDSYAPALPLGAPIESAGVGKVVTSRNAKLKEGAYVWGGFGWQTHFVSDGRGVQALDPEIYKGSIKPTAAIGVFGIPGLTAFFGLFEIGKPKEGNVVLVSSGAGTVGATAGQIAKAQGCTVIGLAGSDAKCAYLKEIGFDIAINYKTAGDLAAAFKAAAPKGIDIYFDNVGGETLDAAIVNMRRNGRIVVSGQISEYNTAEKPRGIRNTLPFITQRLRMEGLVVYDYGVQFNEARAQMAEWVRAGKLSYREEIIDGIERAPRAFIGLFTGESFGRRLVHVGG
jgi:NADPH-dependent curcumin reductase CurA